MQSFKQAGPLACSAVALMLAMLFFSNFGCGNQQLEDLASKAKQGIDQTAKNAQEQAGELSKKVQNLPNEVAAVTAGEIKLTLDVPLQSATCAARFTPPTSSAGQSRQGLLQIGTSLSGPKSFPAVYLHAPTDAASLQALVGQSVQGQLFIAKSETQGHYQSPPEKPVTVQIVKVEKNVVTCQVQAGELTCLDQPQTLPIAGMLVGAVQN
jgi:hypothetical protein